MTVNGTEPRRNGFRSSDLPGPRRQGFCHRLSNFKFWFHGIASERVHGVTTPLVREGVAGISRASASTPVLVRSRKLLTVFEMPMRSV